MSKFCIKWGNEQAIITTVLQSQLLYIDTCKLVVEALYIDTCKLVGEVPYIDSAFVSINLELNEAYFQQ